MFNYEKHPLNAWIYGISMLAMLLIPMIVYLLEFSSIQPWAIDGMGEYLQNYLSVMLFPYALSSEFLFQIPYLGVTLAIASFVIHLHIYSTIIERVFALLNHRVFSRTAQSESDY